MHLKAYQNNFKLYSDDIQLGTTKASHSGNGTHLEDINRCSIFTHVSSERRAMGLLSAAVPLRPSLTQSKKSILNFRYIFQELVCNEPHAQGFTLAHRQTLCEIKWK